MAHAAQHQAPAADMFLSPAEVAEMTGIRRGTKGKPYPVLQVEWLLAHGYPAHVNRAGRAIVARSAVDGQHQRAAEPANTEWTPDAWRA
ncbi:DUF4224 domain-containing protein [Achromobacter denitrificans]|nr:DUF4224 domain-containing protein [Achromobacter denitrificans]